LLKFELVTRICLSTVSDVMCLGRWVVRGLGIWLG